MADFSNLKINSITYSVKDATARANLATEITNRSAADSSEASTRALAINTLQEEINSLVAPSGSAPSAAEVIDARIGADSVTYNTLGTAIRTQFNKAKQDQYINAFNILDNSVKTNRVANGITFAWNANECTITGTSTGEIFCNIYANASALPYGVGAGSIIYPGLKNQNVARMQIYSFDSNGAGTLIYNSQANYSVDYITVPANATGMSIRLWIGSGITVSETVYPYVCIDPPNSVLNSRTFKCTTNRLIYIISSGNTTSNRAAEIQTALNNYDRVILCDGDFYISTFLTIPSGKTLEGFGHSTRIYANGSNVTSIVLNDYSTIKNLQLDGGLTSRPTSQGSRYGIYVNSITSPFWIENVTVHGFDNVGLYIGETGTASVPCFIRNVYIYQCYTGLQIINSEYEIISDTVVRDCYRGCYELGGNNKYVNCGFDSNAIGIQITPTYANNTHGEFVSCSINHNSTYAIYASAANNGELFSACQIHFGIVSIGGTSALLFNGCQFGNQVTIEKSGTGNSYFMNNIHYATPTITNTGSGAFRFINCYNFMNGNAVIP